MPSEPKKFITISKISIKNSGTNGQMPYKTLKSIVRSIKRTPKAGPARRTDLAWRSSKFLILVKPMIKGNKGIKKGRSGSPPLYLAIKKCPNS